MELLYYFKTFDFSFHYKKIQLSFCVSWPYNLVKLTSSRFVGVEGIDSLEYSLQIIKSSSNFFLYNTYTFYWFFMFPMSRSSTTMLNKSNERDSLALILRGSSQPFIAEYVSCAFFWGCPLSCWKKSLLSLGCWKFFFFFFFLTMN